MQGAVVVAERVAGEGIERAERLVHQDDAWPRRQRPRAADALPLAGSISRSASRSSVVLPEPEPPTMARNSPSATSIVRSSTALTRPPSKLLPTCANAIRGGAAVMSWNYHTAFEPPSRRGACMLPGSVELSKPGR